MATNTIGYYLVPNTTGKTTGSFIRIIPNGTAYFADVAADVMASLSTTQQRLAMVWNETVRVALAHVAEGHTVDLGGIRMRPRIPGSMLYEDQPFTPGTDEVIVELYEDSEIASAFDDVIPYRVTAEDVAGSLKVSNIMDVATEAFATVIGTTSFAVLGNGITLDGPDEYAKAYAKKTGSLLGTATIDRVERGQRAYCHFATALAPGEVTLEIATHGLAGETALRKFAKSVTVLASETPVVPTITSVQQTGRAEPNQIKLSPSVNWVINGTDLAHEGDTVWVELYSNETGELIDWGNQTSGDAPKIVSSTPTQITLNGVWWESKRPDGEWYNAYPLTKVVIKRGDQRIEFPMTFTEN